MRFFTPGNIVQITESLKIAHNAENLILYRID
jgi:hypothetical protein